MKFQALIEWDDIDTSHAVLALSDLLNDMDAMDGVSNARWVSFGQPGEKPVAGEELANKK